MSKFDSDLQTTSRNFKDFIHQLNCREEILYLNKKHDTTDLTTNKNSFSNNHTVDVFSVCYCSNLTIGYKFGFIFIMQTQET